AAPSRPPPWPSSSASTAPSLRANQSAAGIAAPHPGSAGREPCGSPAQRRRDILKATLANALLVGCGGFFGSVLRYTLSGAVQRLFPLSAFPLGTVRAHLIG